MSQPFVAVLMGSDSDLPMMEACFDVLKSLEIPMETRITSAHRTPWDTRDYVVDADQRGCAVFIAAAGMAAKGPPRPSSMARAVVKSGDLTTALLWSGRSDSNARPSGRPGD